MVKRAIVWTETAAKQRRAILKFWTVRNGSSEYATELIKITKTRVIIIAKHPESGLEIQNSKTRMSGMGHFSLFYNVTHNSIIIVAFWDNRQDHNELYNLIKE